uniref:Uncharacterized protein n=1 Tax=Oryza rufipogon TaxID=4529 RepID=A0A0E0PYS1_ORYRU
KQVFEEDQTVKKRSPLPYGGIVRCDAHYSCLLLRERLPPPSPNPRLGSPAAAHATAVASPLHRLPTHPLGFRRCPGFSPPRRPPPRSLSGWGWCRPSPPPFPGGCRPGGSLALVSSPPGRRHRRLGTHRRVVSPRGRRLDLEEGAGNLLKLVYHLLFEAIAYLSS